ncbi:hypothetical protein SHIRM173S_12097 [Streptomyces hirsutus]
MGLTAGVLAVDAGNSKTDVAVVTHDGEVLATVRGGGFQPPAVGVPAAVDALAGTVAAALTAAGASGVAHVSACLANADLPVEEERLTAALAARGWGDTVEVRNDTFALLRAGVTEPRGVAVVCGAGINCVGMRPDGRTARFPALGRISGDWGGGWALAEEALWHAARAEDGRGPATALAGTLPAHFGLPGHAGPHRGPAPGAPRAPAPSRTGAGALRHGGRRRPGRGRDLPAPRPLRGGRRRPSWRDPHWAARRGDARRARRALAPASCGPTASAPWSRHAPGGGRRCRPVAGRGPPWAWTSYGRAARSAAAGPTP